MIKQPVGVIQMTNVAMIRYRTNRKDFEIACYKNKAINWRNGVEKNLDEVLQTDMIYTSVTSGTIASKKELDQYFPDKSKEEIIKTILEKGDLQLGDKERSAQIQQLYKSIVKFIQEKCIHPDSKRHFSIQSIEYAISKTNFVVKQDSPMKRQALLCIKLLQELFYLQRAQMKVSITITNTDKDKLLETFHDLDIVSQSNPTEKPNQLVYQLIIGPSKFRPLSQILKDDFKKSALEVLEADISNKEVEDIENAGTVELEMRKEKIQIASSSESDEDGQRQHQNKKKQNKQKNKPKDKKNNNQEKNEEQYEEQKQTQVKKEQSSEPKAGNQKEFKCSMCLNAQFDTNPDFRQHYKSDWHNFNLKLKNKKQPAITQEEYLELILTEQLSL